MDNKTIADKGCGGKRARALGLHWHTIVVQLTERNLNHQVFVAGRPYHEISRTKCVCR